MESGTVFELRTTEVTLEELRELDSFKDYTQQQADALIQAMKIFVRIIYNIWAKEEQTSKDNKDNNKRIAINIANPIKTAA